MIKTSNLIKRIYSLGCMNTQQLVGNNVHSLLNEYNSIVNQSIDIVKFFKLFSSDDECLELYFLLKYEGCTCSKCNRSVTENYKRINRRNKNGIREKTFRCKCCHTCVYPLSNTIFRKSKLSLRNLFYLIYMLCLYKKSMSASYISQNIGMSYKTAHKFMMLIRTVLLRSEKEKMKGIIEVDEAFLGTGSKMYNWSGISTRKQPIIGLVERETKQVRMFLAPNRNQKTIHNLIRSNVEEGSIVYTDSWKGYNGLSEYYIHESVNHSTGEYVRGDVHTNSIESVWSMLKNNLRGTHIKISDKYVHLYISEACWRHNSRGKATMFLFNEILQKTFFSPYCY